MLPAIPLIVACTPWNMNDPFHNSIAVWDGRTLVAIWDFNFDRCMDFHYPCGVYVNGRQIEEGVTRYMQGE